MKFTEHQIMARFGITAEQVRAMHSQNAQGLRQMLAKAERTGKKVGNYTADQLRKFVADADALAQGRVPE